MSVPAKLQLGSTEPLALFADWSEDTCLLTQSYVGRKSHTHRLILGVHGHAMMLSPGDVRGLLPHLSRFARTGSLLHDEPLIDYSI